MDGHIDYLDDGKITLEQRREVMRTFDHTLHHDKDLERMLFWAHNKKTVTSANCWAVLLTMNWNELVAFQCSMRTRAAKEKEGRLSAFLMAVRNVGEVIWWMSQTDRSTRELDLVRNNPQREVTLSRDGFRCVLTYQSSYEYCHVFPFSPLSRRSEIQANVVEPLGAILSIDLKHKLMEILNRKASEGEKTAPGDFDLLDSPANKITLSSSLRKMWNNRVFGLEPVRQRHECVTIQEPVAEEKPGTGPSTVKRAAEAAKDESPHKKVTAKGDRRGKEAKFSSKKKLMHGIELRFHWLQKTKMGGFDDSPPTMDADPRQMWKCWDHENELDVAVPLKNGHTFTIWSEDPQKVPNWELMTFQWLLFRLHRLSGAANVNLYAPREEQEKDKTLVAKFIQARREATEMVAERLGVDPDKLWSDPRGPYYCIPADDN
ncbi:hypothetical protein CGCF415_v014928 [Colletotrichum fructicola]|nr:hypothetical protein CGCF415_v014928 [Colletotrichum fructicola]